MLKSATIGNGVRLNGGNAYGPNSSLSGRYGDIFNRIMEIAKQRRSARSTCKQLATLDYAILLDIGLTDVEIRQLRRGKYFIPAVMRQRGARA